MPGRPKARCKRCAKPMTWLRTLNGEWMPVDGHIVVNGGIWEPAMGSHWETCPFADQFKREQAPEARPQSDQVLADTIDGVDIYLRWNLTRGYFEVRGRLRSGIPFFGQGHPDEASAIAWARSLIRPELPAEVDEDLPELPPDVALGQARALDVIPAAPGRGHIFLHVRLPLVELHAAGSCSKQRGPGGWCCVMVSGERIREVGGQLEQTTPLQANCLALLRGLECLSRPCELEVYSGCRQLVTHLNNLEGLARLAEMGAHLCQAGQASRTDQLFEAITRQLRAHTLDVCVPLYERKVWSEHDARAHDLARAFALEAETLSIGRKRA